MPINSSANPYGRKRKAVISLANLSGDDRAALKPAERRIAMLMAGDPLGIISGQHARREGWAVGDASPQRLARAHECGSMLADEAIELDGAPALGVVRSTNTEKRLTGKRKRIVSRLEILYHQGKVDPEMMAGARMFQNANVRSFDCSIGLVAHYGGADSPGHHELHPVEAIAENGREIAILYKSVSSERRHVLTWIGQEAYRDVSLEALGQYVSPWLKTRQSKCKHAISAIKSVLTMLAEFYNLKNERHATIRRS